MKLSKKLRKVARQMEESASIWDNDQTKGWDELADEAEGLEDHLEEVDGYLSYERSQVVKLKAENAKLLEDGSQMLNEKVAYIEQLVTTIDQLEAELEIAKHTVEQMFIDFGLEPDAIYWQQRCASVETFAVKHAEENEKLKDLMRNAGLDDWFTQCEPEFMEQWDDALKMFPSEPE